MDISVTIHNKRKHKQSIKDKDTSRAFDKISKKQLKIQFIEPRRKTQFN